MLTNSVRWLGRHARGSLPIAVFIGILLPDLASLLRPLLTLAVIGTLTAVIIRLDWLRLMSAIRSPLLTLLLAGWQLIVSPLLIWGLVGMAGLPPVFAVALLLQAAAPPIGSVAAFALILRLDATQTLLASVLMTILLPLSLTPIVALVLPEAGIDVDIARFFGWVSTVVAAPFALGVIIRRLVGVDRLARNDEFMAGINVLLLLIFAIAVMDGVTDRLFADPLHIAQLLVLACVAGLLHHAAGYLLFRRAGPTIAWSAALLTGNRNMGLMLAVTAGTAGETFSLFAGVAQIPMYFAPLLLAPLVNRSMRSRERGAARD